MFLWTGLKSWTLFKTGNIGKLVIFKAVYEISWNQGIFLLEGS